MESSWAHSCARRNRWRHAAAPIVVELAPLEATTMQRTRPHDSRRMDSTNMIKIRPATDGDLDAVERLLSTSDLPLEGVAENFQNFLVAEAGGEVAGAIGLERFGS